LRAAITIVYNGMHHFQHNGFVPFMLEHFDYWIIVEGHCRNGGSTSWCKHMNIPHRSTDGTAEYIETLQSDTVLTYSHHKYYASKDEQFNKGIQLLKTKTNKCYLWQVDVDEHWTAYDLNHAERKLWRSATNCASFQFNHYVGSDYIAVGDWGSGWVNRLWKWTGQPFTSHEPATMLGQVKPIQCSQKFDHYSMVFEEDVRFKAKYYRGHEEVYKNWRNLDTFDYPVHISALFGKNNSVGRSNSQLFKKSELSCANVTSLANQKNNEIIC